MKTCQVTLLVWMALIPVSYELNLYCDGAWCEATNMSCLEQHPYKVESAMCFPNTTAPTIPAGASKTCTPCSPPNESGAEVEPEGVRYTLLSVDPSKFRVAVQWEIYSTVGLSSFEVRVYEMQQMSASLLFCLCLDKQTFTFEFEETYSKCTQYGVIRVQIISEPYVEGYIESNMATIQFQCPLKCSDIPFWNFMGCDYVYSDPVVSVYPLINSNGTYVYVSMATPTLAQTPPPSYYYYVTLSSQSEGVTCANSGMTSCFTTNQTSFPLGPLNSSVTYQLTVQLYVPCSNGPCTNRSTVTIKPLSASLSLQPVVTMAIGSPVPLEVVSGSFTDVSLKWVEVVVPSVVMVIGISALVGVLIFCRCRRVTKMSQQGTDCTAHIYGATPFDTDLTLLSGVTPLNDAVCNDVTPPNGAVTSELPNHTRRRNSIFVAYSNQSTSLERKVILNNLVYLLKSDHQMEVHGHDIMIQKGITPYKVEQICQSSVVLCVCNKSFFEEWNAETPPSQASTVPLIKSLLAADLQKGKDISKYAVVLMKRGDAHYIPTNYLSSNKQFLVIDVEGIAEFIKKY